MSGALEDLGALSPLKRALLALTDMQAQLDAEARARSEPIAITGLGCRFPGATTPQAFWRALCDSVDGISEVPADRWDVDAYYDPDPAAPGKMSTRWGGFLDQVDQFDADFFGISPREALWMDPQQRLLLEVAWEALEDAGQTANRWSERPAGVFIGVSSSDYVWHQVSAAGEFDAYTSTGNSYSIIANRLSYLLDLKGPSLVVDTACSSSLVAVHLACQSLRNRECHLALAGGVNLVLSPMGTISLSKYGMMAADGRCKTFDARADGFVRGEGCGVVVLKRLSDALAAEDPVLALIRGSAVNQDGRSNGLTAPNMRSQQAVIRQALAQAGVAGQDVQYIETHGTGTAMGDPIETEALKAALGAPQDSRECVIGSVKANIGHLEAAAGIAGLIKVVMALQHERIPPQIHFRTLNPHISLAHSPLVIAAAGRTWRRNERPRFAGVSSFGFGGTNAHAVLEEAPERQKDDHVAPSGGRACLLPLSARSPGALLALARAYEDTLHGDNSLHDVCYTASVSRNHHAYRLAVWGRSTAELVERLHEFVRTEQRPALPRLGPVFVFGGEGDQWAGMGRGLLAEEAVFREAVEEIDILLRGHVDWSLTNELLAGDARSRLTGPDIARPALLALQIGLAALWRSWGIEPAAVAGQGVGEVAAAYVAGALSLANAVKVSVQRTFEGVDIQPAAIPIVPALIGREPVHLADAVMALVTQGHEVFLEVSPHPVLGEMMTECLAASGRAGVTLASLRRSHPEREVMLASLGRLYGLGYTIAWSRLYPRAGRRVPLPAYPWQHKRFWPAQTGTHTPAARKRVPSHPLLGDYLQVANSGAHCWQTIVDRDSCPYLNDHRVQGAMVFPAAAYVEMALAAGAAALGAGPHALEQIVFKKAMFIPENASQTVQLIVSEEVSGSAEFQLLSRQATAWVLHATGTIRRGTAIPAHSSVEHIRTRCAERITGAEYYQALRTQGLEYGPTFQGVQQIWRRDGEAIGRVQVPPAIVRDTAAYQVHPALLDAGFQLLGAAVPRAQAQVAAGDIYLPVRLSSVRIHGRLKPGAELWGHVVAQSGAEPRSNAFVGDLFLMDADGQVVLEAIGLRVERLDSSLSEIHDDPSDWLYEIRWLPMALPRTVSSSGPNGPWLILADTGGIGSAVRALLEARGETCVTLVAGDADPAQREELGRLLREAFGETPPRGIIHLWGLDAALPDALTIGSLETAQQLGCRSALHLVQALGSIGWRQPPRLWLITRGAHAAAGEQTAINLSQSTLLGLGRVIALEHPELRCTEVDLGPEASQEEIAALVEELFADDAEGELALRGGTRYAARLTRWSPGQGMRTRGLEGDEPFRLDCDKPGFLDHLCLRATTRRLPGPGEVEIRVAAAALNFNDVLKALDLYPDRPPGAIPLGSECAGAIVRLGAGVEGLAAGQDVVALAEASAGAFVTTPAAMVAPRPPRLAVEEAVTLPIAFMTAVYALKHLGRLASGDRVLIHAAAGGVGLAAIQVARRAGAEIFATAGNPEKRAFLESLGVRHVMDSRSLAFADEVMAVTGGRGMDVVLNSLAGEAMLKSLDLMAPYGRFLELGKRDLYENRRVGLWPFRKGVSYLPVDLAGLVDAHPAQFNALWREVMQDVAAGVWQPLPHRVFPIDEAVTAFRDMAQGKHIGKLVLSTRDMSAAVIAPAAEPPVSFSAQGSYLITGGLGGLGLQVARWMVERGARHLVLIGRRDPSESARHVVDALEQTGARVVAVRADVSSASQMARVLADAHRDLPPLRGVIHAAGVIDDGLLLQQDWDRFRSVTAPKVEGAWILHTLTLDRRLDFFVLFSSMAAVVGSFGQSSYAAANAFLDGLAAYRRAQGLSGLSINWGPWAEVGMAAADGAMKERMRLMGVRAIAPQAGLQVLGKILTQRVARIGVMPINWREFPSGATAPSLVADLIREEGHNHSADGREDEGRQFREALFAAAAEARQPMLDTYLREQLARVLGSATSEIDLDQPLSNLGIDSLMAVELRTRIQTDLRVTVPIAGVLAGPSLRQMSGVLLEQLTAKWLVDASRRNAAESEWEVLRI
jgi:acyl transferase domain-containing protein